MQFTIASKGRPIGTTDLAFLRIAGPIRNDPVWNCALRRLAPDTGIAMSTGKA